MDSEKRVVAREDVTIKDVKEQKENAERVILSVLETLCRETGLKLEAISFETLSATTVSNDDFYSVDKVHIELKL